MECIGYKWRSLLDLDNPTDLQKTVLEMMRLNDMATPATGDVVEVSVRLKRQTPIQLEDVVDTGGDPQSVFCRGHVLKKLFAAKVQERDGDPVELDEVKHEWWRARPDPSRNLTCFYDEAKPNSNGAFKVTVLRY